VASGRDRLTGVAGGAARARVILVLAGVLAASAAGAVLLYQAPARVSRFRSVPCFFSFLPWLLLNAPVQLTVNVTPQEIDRLAIDLRTGG
jgi:hypothetical protein